MVLIECFTPRHIENISTCLRLKPQKLVMISKGEEMEEPLKRYRSLLEERLPKTAVKDCDVTGFDFGDCCAEFRKLLAPEEEYAIDLSGGDALTVMAMGAAVAELTPQKRQSIRVLKYDEKLETLQDCIHDCREIPGAPVELTVREVIRLHGGMVHPASWQPPEDFTVRRLAPLWKVVTSSPGDWNKQQGYLSEAQKIVEKREEEQETVREGETHNLPLQLLKSKMSPKVFEEKEKGIRALLSEMDRRGVAVDRSNNRAFSYTYTDPVFRWCLEKAGNALELKVLLEARALEVDGKKYFNDCMMGVHIDWDGKIKNEGPRMIIPETRNEIDVVLMHGLIPYFISCKNGTIEEEEIYKLSVVSRFFGGPHARVMLIATKPDAVGGALIQRALDMGVQLVPNAAEKDHDWRRMFLRTEEEEQ